MSYWWTPVHSEGNRSPKSVTVYERTQGIQTEASLLHHNGRIYLSEAFLTGALKLETKTLPNGDIGLCLDDFCVPMSNQGDVPNIIPSGSHTYLSISHFIEALDGAVVYEESRAVLLLDFQTRVRGNRSETSGPIDFTLPSMDGDSISLSDYRGERVVLFAWASW